VWTPAKKLANFLESYASILEIPVWTSANVSKVYRPEAGGGWRVDVDVQGERKTLNTKHVIFALGISGAASIPDILWDLVGGVRAVPHGAGADVIDYLVGGVRAVLLRS
jgi:hypothetical protein